MLFSSTAAIFGSTGQANHAAANTFMDALAHYRQQQGLPALSINWGVWSEVGIAAEKNVAERVKSQGVGAIFPDQGLSVLDKMLHNDISQIIVTPIQWQIFLKHYSNGSKPAWLSDMVQEVERVRPSRPASTPDKTTVSVLRQLEDAPQNQKRDLLLAYVNEQAVKVLGLDSSELIDPRQPLQELGLDSLTAVELRNMLRNGLQMERSLLATLVFDYPTINALTDYLAQDILKLQTKKPETKITDTDKPDLLQNIENLSDEEVGRMLSNLE